jgi:L-ascorbate metabolism protein UlaG (beta-lactamase superfamily)
MIDKIQWLGHGSFVIQGPPLIYINPWRVTRKAFHPDVILIGHGHYAHCSPADIDKLRGPDTHILTNELVAQEIEGCTVLRPWQSITVGNARITGIPAYSPDEASHPLEAGGLGFVVSIQLYDIYYAGDTQKIPEMDLIKPDIAILPIDGNGTLTVSEAVAVVKEMKPRWAIPSNLGSGTEGATSLDAQRFKDAVGDQAEVIILDQTR